MNLAPLSVEDFRRLKERNIGTFQLFQETYHRPTYGRVHLAGPKKDLDWRASTTWAWGCSTGLYDWRFETLALMAHIAHLEERFGVGCHTISVPRIEPAIGSDLASRPPYTLNDQDFLKLVAILRLAVPYTGIIMSTREKPAIRQRTLELGVSQISAGSRTNPGGYQESSQFEAAQFQLGDHRSLAEVIADLGQHKFIPSFCTGCYRLGRTGKDFMGLAKPGLIKEKCAPSALSTFEEYLLDTAHPKRGRPGSAALRRRWTVWTAGSARFPKTSPRCGTAAGTPTVRNLLTMNSADGFRIGQSLSREPSRQGMKSMVGQNHINVLRREVLRRIAESFLHYADFGNSVERIPFVMVPKIRDQADAVSIRIAPYCAFRSWPRSDSGLKTRKTTPRLCPCMLKRPWNGNSLRPQS